MDLILCHTTADFDTLGAAVGVARLLPGARIVLTGGAHPGVQQFLALHRDEYPLIEARSVNLEKVQQLVVVDAQTRDRLGNCAAWLDQLRGRPIRVYDHHLAAESDLGATELHIEAVGATSTLIAEQLQQQDITLNPYEATVMALGIHVDTGSLTFDHTTLRDAQALVWLMGQGASLPVIGEYVQPSLSPQVQELLTQALETLEPETVHGYSVAQLLVHTQGYVGGLSSLAAQIQELADLDALLLGAVYEDRLSLIGRARKDITQLNELLAPLGGGGHARAASASIRGVNAQQTLNSVYDQLKAQIPPPLQAKDLMSSPVRTIRPDTTIDEAQRVLLRYGHSGLSVVNEQGALVGVISRRDLDIALHHGFGHAPVRGYMTSQVRTITPDTPLPEIETLMVTYDIGRLPVLDGSELIGIVTRTDVLRQLHAIHRPLGLPPGLTHRSLAKQLEQSLDPTLWTILKAAAEQTHSRGWQLYLVGGAVRDVLLGQEKMVIDLDLVVDGDHRTLQQGAGIELAQVLQASYPEARLQVHGRFQTAALLWPEQSTLGPVWIDIATARTEFYPYPAAHPEVEASSIQQDLYRRDFTINALAVRLSGPRAGELLDFFGGMLDLEAAQVRVLHANSFIEDPTRIYRAVRFAVRLGFQIEPQTEGYIRHAVDSGLHDAVGGDRLKGELHYILEADYWRPALKLLANLGALRCIHAELQMTPALWQQVARTERWLKRFDTKPQRLNHLQTILELLIASLKPEQRGDVAQKLHLTTDSIERLENLAQTEQTLCQYLGRLSRPSEIVFALREVDLGTLVLFLARSRPPLRRFLWCYLTTWSLAQPPLTGDDLKQLGYRPGRSFRTMLDALLAAKLDGEVTTPEQAVSFLKENFPLN
ncbi:CBS domain-containing protein [Leptolyngbya sp. FACHB-261]|uniref:CBS domain-containing protein n=1 Tax=Leptolyngbya sp. FACHB-261 TaxID=2692806 RepID=UPI001683F868|nr:CBS domain-containing protein [Leptolyngbya sp. FACHB-261]MBD2104147.1 CBS domain-containing protein [Leptolyngbya sp. FACHB-261]